ncbi:MAG: 4-vinyl reductase, partial [Staphylothermus sp.]|nr:4-vinyl reductase [Staphylothermus sp.]
IYSVIKDNTPGASFFLMNFGKGIGKALYERYVREIDEIPGYSFEEKVSAAMDLFCNLYKALGLGDMNIVEKGAGKYIVSIKNNFECCALKMYGTGRGYPIRAGFITRGIIAGFYEKLFNRVVEVQEKDCILEGNDTDVFIVRIRESIFSE